MSGCFSGLSTAHLLTFTSPGLTLEWTHPSTLPSLSPPLHLLLPSPILFAALELLASQFACWQVIFRKDHRPRTTPTPISQDLTSPPHPDRRHSSTFVSIFPLPVHPTRSSSADRVPFFFPFKNPPPLSPPCALLLYSRHSLLRAFLSALFAWPLFNSSHYVLSELTSTCSLHLPFLLFQIHRRSS